MILIDEHGRVLEDAEISLILKTPEGPARINRLMRRQRCAYATYRLLGILANKGMFRRRLSKEEYEDCCLEVHGAWLTPQEAVDAWTQEAIAENPECYETVVGNA